MKGRGLLTLSGRNRGGGSCEQGTDVALYDHDALSLDALHEYDPPAQQMQDMGSGFHHVQKPVLSHQPPVGLAQTVVGLGDGISPIEPEQRSVEMSAGVAITSERCPQPQNGLQSGGYVQDYYSPPEVERDDISLYEDAFADEDDEPLDDTAWLDDFSANDIVVGGIEDQQYKPIRRASYRNLRYERSRQLAEQFLSQFDLLDEKSLDLLTEVVYHKRWSATQYRVRKLMRAGLSVEQIHAAFELRRVWSMLVDSNPVPDYWRKALSWDGATALLSCIGDWEVEVDGWHAHFLQCELESWLRKMARGRWDGHFIDYLLNFRFLDATHVEQVVDPAFCIGLDGSHNPLFDREWMEDWDDMGPPAERQLRLNVLLGREGLNVL